MTDFKIDVVRTWRNDETYISCPHISSYESDIDKIVKPDEIVAPEDTITILFDYPLSNAVELEFTNPGGFNRVQFCKAVHDGYTQIYQIEDGAVGDPGMIPGMLNRQSSDGPYGIWGHVMSDLYLESIESCGDGRYKLGIGS